MWGWNIEVGRLLLGVFWWRDVGEKEGKREGWIYKTGSELFEEFGVRGGG